MYHVKAERMKTSRKCEEFNHKCEDHEIQNQDPKSTLAGQILPTPPGSLLQQLYFVGTGIGIISPGERVLMEYGSVVFLISDVEAENKEC